MELNAGVFFPRFFVGLVSMLQVVDVKNKKYLVVRRPARIKESVKTTSWPTVTPASVGPGSMAATAPITSVIKFSHSSTLDETILIVLIQIFQMIVTRIRV